MSLSQTRSLFIIYKTAIADQYVSVSNAIAFYHLQNRDRCSICLSLKRDRSLSSTKLRSPINMSLSQMRSLLIICKTAIALSISLSLKRDHVYSLSKIWLVSLFICTLDLGFLKPLCSKDRKLIIVISGVCHRGLLHLASKTALTITELSK
jgi:hypothetical protein